MKIRWDNSKLIIILLLIINLLINIAAVLNYNIPFATDQGRDMLALRDIAVGRHVTLIGPTTSINGVFLGPFFYYFNLIPFILGRGDPTAQVIWQILFYALAGLSFWLANYRTNRIFALILSSMFLLCPAFFSISRVAFSAYPMPIFTSFLFIILVSFLEKGDGFKAVLIGLLSGIVLQIEAALGFIFFPFVLIVFLLNKSKPKYVSLYFLGFFLTLLFQITFELKHNFIMTHTLINEVIGKTAILGEKINLYQTILVHFEEFYQRLDGILQFPLIGTGLIFALAVIFLSLRCYKNKINSTLRYYFIIAIIFIVLSYVFYLFYHYPLKAWFLDGLLVPLLVILAAFFSEIFTVKNFLPKVAVTVLLLFSFISTLVVQTQVIQNGLSQRSDDRSNLRNEMEAVDYVYKETDNQAFKVFSYLPSVYDYPYQYIFWWYGTRKYGYQPDTISYLPDVPEYIDNNLKYLTKRKSIQGSTYPVFLIIEKDYAFPVRQAAWLGNFTNLCLVKSYIFPWQTQVQERIACIKTPKS